MEIWLRSPLGPEHVEVSNLGNVRTLPRLAPSARDKQPTQLRAGKTLNPWVSKQGYYIVAIKEGSKRTKYAVHRLVASAFCPGFDASLSVNHIDGNKLNNHAGNLEWVSLQMNTALAWQTGQCTPEAHAIKLTPETVRQIKLLLAQNLSVAKIAPAFGVSESMVYKIRDGARWASVA